MRDLHDANGNLTLPSGRQAMRQWPCPAATGAGQTPQTDTFPNGRSDRDRPICPKAERRRTSRIAPARSGQSARSSQTGRCLEIIVEPLDCRLMRFSRIATQMRMIMKITTQPMPRWCNVCRRRLFHTNPCPSGHKPAASSSLPAGVLKVAGLFVDCHHQEITGLRRVH